MTVPRTCVVTAHRGGVYRVELHPSREGWTVRVERDGKCWTFAIARGPAEGLARLDGRPLRWSWDGRSGTLLLDGMEHALTVQTEAEHRIAASSVESHHASRVQEIRAPMPGLVLAVEVGEGQAVEAGQGLFVIEAMKMENEITAPASGIVRAIEVGAGQPVERGMLLCRVEPPPEAIT